MPNETVLSAGEWEALLFQAPDQVRALVYRLAIHHGVIEKPAAQGVLKYNPTLPDGPEAIGSVE